MHRQHTSDLLLDEAKASFAIIAAQHRGQRLARQIADPARDREDHRQDNACKQDIIAAVSARGFEPADDNEADAIAILLWALETKGGVA